jgi:2-keto-myo-inositol isomerase
MKLALNGATIMRSPLADDLVIAAECGFDALEIWAGKLPAYRESRTLDDLRDDLARRGIAPSCINSIEDITHRDAAGRRALMAQVEETSGVARAIGAPSIVVVPGARPAGATARDSIDDAVDVLRELSALAGDVALAFEFLGKPRCAVPMLDMAIEVVERVDRANVGLVIDTFHFYAGASRLEDISRVPVDKLLVVHLNGCEDLPRDQLTDAHRLYPGEGVIPIDDILAGIRAGGYDGTFSIEIFRPAYWEQEPRAVARNARGKAAAVLSRVGYAVAGAADS